MAEMTELIEKLRSFAKERDWNQFHSPKNISMALSVEVGELLEHFQWLTESQSKDLSQEQKQEVGEELADVFLYLLRLSDVLGIDLLDAASTKILKNAKKYPVETSKGTAKKYTKL